IPAISASDEIERGERRRNGLNAGEQPLVVLGLLFFQRCDLLVDARAARLYRIDVAHGHGVAQLASTADNSNNAPVRISPSTNGLLYPDLKLPFDHVNQHLDPFVAVIEARNVAEVFAAMLEEDVLVILRNLLKRLNAIGGKAWADDGNPLDSVSRQRFDRLVSIRLDPLCPAKARLEGKLEPGTERSERVAQSLDRAQALLLIRVAVVHIILRQSMKRCEDDFRLEIKVAKMRPHRFSHRVDIDRVVGIRRD